MFGQSMFGSVRVATQGQHIAEGTSKELLCAACSAEGQKLAYTNALISSTCIFAGSLRCFWIVRATR